MAVEVILREDVPNLGGIGEIVRVRPGYARNYLYPRGLAVEASRKNVSELDHQKRQQLALELAKIQHEELPVIISYWIEAQRATTKAVNGFPTAPDNFIDLRATWLSS